MDFSFLDDWAEEEAPSLEQTGEGYRNIWVLVEVAERDPAPSSLATLGQARELADQMGVYVFGLLLGSGIEAPAQELIAYGADRVLAVDDPLLADYQPERYVHIVADLVEQHRPEILLMAATPLGNDLAPRLAQQLDTGLIGPCIRLGADMSERLLLGAAPIWGGEMHHTLACPGARPQMATLLPDRFSIPYPDSTRLGQVDSVLVDLEDVPPSLTWLDRAFEFQPPEPTLAHAPIVVAAGRGMEDAAGFALVETLAQRLGGRTAGSRGALDEGWIQEDQIVGVAGHTVAPALYVACGLSGDIYHAFGARKAQFIVAINPDPEAPIHKIAHLSVLADARQVIPAMLEALES